MGLQDRDPRGRKYLVPNKPERNFMKWCLARRRDDGWTYRQIAQECERQKAEAEGRKPLAFGFHSITANKVRSAIAAELRIQERERADREAWEECHRHDPVIL